MLCGLTPYKAFLKQTLKKLLPKNRFARSVSILAGGTAAGQAITVLASPLLTRLYTPDDFGVLAVYASLLMTIGVIASLRYQLAIPLPEGDQEAAYVAVLSLSIVLGISLLCLVAVIFFRNQIAHLFNTPSLVNHLWLLPPGLLLLGTYQVFNYWALRIKSFTAIARTKLSQSASMVAVQVGGYTLGPVALLLGQITGQAAGITSLGILAVRNKTELFRKIRLIDLFFVARRYKRFPLYSTWGGAFNTAGQHLPPLLFAVLFSPSTAGIYLLSHRVMAMPLAMVGTAIANVFFSNAAEARRKGELAPLVAAIHDKLAQIAMPAALVLIIAGPDLFRIVFGDQWKLSGEFAQWMAIYIYFQFVISPLSQLVSVLEKQIHGSVFQIVLFIVQLTALLIGGLYSDPIFAVAFFSLGSAFCYFAFLAWIVRETQNKWSLLFIPSLNALIWSTISVAPLILFYVFSDNEQLWFVAVGFSGLLLIIRYLFIVR